MLKTTQILIVLFAVAASTIPVTIAARQSHSFSVHDLVTMKRISDPHVSPDGTQIVFVLRETDMDANRGRTDLWSVGMDGSGLRRLTTNHAADFNPRWTPDGSAILFLSTRSGLAQIWRLPTAGGEAVQVSHQPLDVSNLIVSASGQFLAFSMDVFVDCENLDCTTGRLDAQDGSKTSGKIYDKLFVRHWDTWSDGRHTHIFVSPAAGGQTTDIMKGMKADSPTRPFGGSEEFTFTPDEKSIVFTARISDEIEVRSTDFNLYLAPIDGSKSPTRLTANKAWDTGPVFAPDGKTLAYLAMATPDYESDRFRIMLRHWPDSTEHALSADWDRSAQTVLWSEDSKTIFTTAPHLGQRSLFAIDVRSGKVTPLIKQGQVRSPSVSGDRIIYGVTNLQSPVELYSIKTSGNDGRSITNINSAALANIKMGSYEQFSFKGWNDETVYGYIVKPSDFDASKKYPVAFLIHGGPQGSFGNNFHYRWNPQVYAGAGYAAVMVDFHGSTGYGQKFTDSIQNDWGGKPLEDLQKGLAAALAQSPWMDGDRVAALGASYGGYMVNWIAGNWPDRFRCLVNHDGLFNTFSFYYETEELWFPERDFMGTPVTSPENYAKHNPAVFVKNWRTPMLVVHGGRDYRVHDAQGISAFTALQRQGIPSKFLYFPDENHFVLKPHNSVQWHDTVLGWLDRWLKEEGTN